MWRIAAYLKPYKAQAIAGLALTAVVTTVMNLAPGLIQRNLINTVLTGHYPLHHLYLMMAVWLSVVVVSVGAQILTGRLTAFLAGHIAADLRAGLYRAIEFLQLGYFDKKQVGAITSRVTQDTDRVWGFLVDGAPFIITNGLLIVGVSGVSAAGQLASDPVHSRPSSDCAAHRRRVLEADVHAVSPGRAEMGAGSTCT